MVDRRMRDERWAMESAMRDTVEWDYRSGYGRLRRIEVVTYIIEFLERKIEENRAQVIDTLDDNRGDLAHEICNEGYCTVRVSIGLRYAEMDRSRDLLLDTNRNTNKRGSMRDE